MWNKSCSISQSGFIASVSIFDNIQLPQYNPPAIKQPVDVTVGDRLTSRGIKTAKSSCIVPKDLFPNRALSVLLFRANQLLDQAKLSQPGRRHNRGMDKARDTDCRGYSRDDHH